MVTGVCGRVKVAPEPLVCCWLVVVVEEPNVEEVDEPKVICVLVLPLELC